MALSKRLLALFRMVEQGSIAADIGCDHGQLAIALVQHGICEHVYACDLRKGPLSRAEEAVAQAQLTKQITCLLKNGIDDLPADCNTVMIAGMGFDTIKGILEAHEQELPQYHTFIIQSNKYVSELRRWISDHHFTIVEEDLIEEDHYYEIIKFCCDVHAPYSEEEILFGVFLTDHPLFVTYWKQRLQKLEMVLEQMPDNHQRRFALMKQKQMIEETIS